LSGGELEAGLVIPSDFATKRTRGEVADVQFLVDSVNSNTGSIAGGYAARVIGALNERISLNKSSVQPVRAVSRVSLFYNAGLQNSWFIVTGMIGMLLVMLGALVASASMVKEKEVGTVEQLLMTPAGSAEIILAKMAPIFLLLSLDIGLSAAVGNLVFGVPIRGSFALLFVAGMLCVLSGIGIGTIIATFTRSQQQAQLMSFFVNPPLSMLSGATTPIEAMPDWMQPLTNLNPVKHFAVLARGVMLKGVGLDVLYPNFLALVVFTAILVGVSAWRFRKQLN
jgi:ABC-2 type transport system permease protein